MPFLIFILQILIIIVVLVEDSLLVDDKVWVLEGVMAVMVAIVVIVVVVVLILVVGFALDADMEWEGDILDCAELTTVVQMLVLQTEEIPLPPPIYIHRNFLVKKMLVL
jgi:hypothetical protein